MKLLVVIDISCVPFTYFVYFILHSFISRDCACVCASVKEKRVRLPLVMIWVSLNVLNNDYPADSPSPIRLDDIKLLIEIGSLDSPNAPTLYQYTDFDEADQFATAFQLTIDRYKFNFNLSRETATKNLPPTSSQTFLREKSTF